MGETYLDWSGGVAECFLEIFGSRKVKQQRVADIDCIVLTSHFSKKKIELLQLALLAVSDGLRRVSQVF